MRWLAKYPITADEVKDTLEKIQCPNTVGTITPLVKLKLKEFFDKPENMAALLESMKV